MANEHRWSGWPGAWCQDCGIEDQIEICVGTCDCGAAMRLALGGS